MKIVKHMLLLIACMTFASADGKRPVKPLIKPEIVELEVFMKYYERVGMAKGLHDTNFVGVQNGVVILKVGEMNPLTKGWREKWIGIKVTELDSTFRAEVEKVAAEIESES